MYVDIDKAVAEALSIRIGGLERRIDAIEARLQAPTSTDEAVEGGTDFKKACTSMGFTEKQILSHDRTGELQDARYQIARILIRGGLTVREVSRIMRRSCRSIQRMI